MMRQVFTMLLVLFALTTAHTAQADTEFKGLKLAAAENIGGMPSNGVTSDAEAPVAATPTTMDHNTMDMGHENMAPTSEPSSEMMPTPDASMPNAAMDATAPQAAHTEEGAESAEGHEGSSGLPQFNPASWPSQIFWLTIIFGTFYALSSLWIVPKMGAMVGKRADYIAENLKQAETLSEQAQDVKDSYELALKTSQATAGDAIKSVQDNAKNRMNASMAEFRTRFESEVANTETDITRAKDSAMADMNKIVATVAAEAAHKIAGVSTDASQAENVVRLLNDKKAEAA